MASLVAMGYFGICTVFATLKRRNGMKKLVLLFPFEIPSDSEGVGGRVARIIENLDGPFGDCNRALGIARRRTGRRGIIWFVVSLG